MVEWWNEECKKAAEERKKAFKEYRKEKTTLKYKKYREIKVETRNLIRKKKKDKFMDFVKSINKNISMTYVWQKMKILRNRKNIVNWNEWKDKNRLETVREDMDKLGKP